MSEFHFHNMIQQSHFLIHPKEMKTVFQGDIYTPVFFAALFTIRKQSVFTDGRMDTVECNSAMRKNKDILTFATIQMKLQGIMK